MQIQTENALILKNPANLVRGDIDVSADRELSIAQDKISLVQNSN